MNSARVFLVWLMLTFREIARIVPGGGTHWRLSVLVLAIIAWSSCSMSKRSSASVTLAPAGGTFVEPTTGVTFVVPPGSLAGPINVSVERLATSDSEVAALPEDARANGTFRITGDASLLKSPIAVGFPLASTSESTQFVAPYTFEGASWSRAHLSDGSGTFGLTAEDGKIAYVVTDHFSDWGIGTHFDIFGNVAGTPNFIWLPTGLFSTSFISAGEALALINSEAKRKTLYVEVIMEIVSRSHRARQPAEMALPKLVAKYATASLHTVDEAVGVTDKLQAGMVAAGAAGMTSQSDLLALQNATDGLDSLGNSLSAATVLADCWKFDVLAVTLFQAMDAGRIRDRFLAFQQMTQGSALYENDPAFSSALDTVSAAFGADTTSSSTGLDAKVSLALWSWLAQNAMDQCGTAALQALSEAVFAKVMPAVAGASDVPGADALAKLVWDYVLQDIIFQDFIAAGQKELVLTALGSILESGLGPSFLADINGLAQTETVPPLLTYGDDAERTKWLMRQNYVYLNESIRRMAEEAVTLTDTSWYNKALKAWVDIFSGLPDRTKIAAALEKQRAYFATKVDAIASAIPTGCEGATDPALVEVCNSPVVLASGQAGAHGIAIDTTNVYWSAAGGQTVMKVPIGGGTPITLASGQGGLELIAVDQTSVYWGNYQEVMKVSISGGAPLALNSTLLYLYGVAVDTNNVYWTDSGGAVMKVPIGGGPRTTLASGQNNPHNIAVDATNVYWTSYGDGTVMAIPISGGTPITLASGQSNPHGIAIDTNNVYWTASGGGTVMTVPISGGTPITLASGQNYPWGIAVSGPNVYWTNSGMGGTVMKVPITGGTPITLASGQNNADEIAVDSTNVYWTSLLDNTVMKVAK